MRLLLVEDDVDLGNVLSQFLEMQGFSVILARTGEKGLEIFNSNNIDLCILDIMLPGMDGHTLARKIKAKIKTMPLLFLTARNTKDDIIKGLRIGADDYICKPFEPEELVLRIRNILRRTGKSYSDGIKVGKLNFKFDQLLISGDGKEHKLTLKEAELFRYLLQNKNKVVKREEILVKLWGENDYFMGRSMDVFISRLRKYLKPEKTIKLETIRGVGFLLSGRDL
ncbi:MAG: response regulator transcription factor [Bacteroidetes bacterium]|nr:response regulator transcription factor [Bacteroidota bacterium]